MEQFKAVFIIVNVGFTEQAVELAQRCGARGATVLQARGSGAKFTGFLGVHYEPERAIILSVVSEEVANKIVEQIQSQIGEETSTNGVCFVMPVDKMTKLS